MTDYKTLERFPGYRFGSDGSVWSRWKRNGSRPAILSGEYFELLRGVSKRGNYVVVIREYGKRRAKTQSVQRLILEAFKGPCPEGMECCHNDGNKLNCEITNLRWDSHASNMADKFQHGQIPLGPEQVAEIRRRLSAGERQCDVAEKFGVSRSHISRIASGKKWGHLPCES